MKSKIVGIIVLMLITTTLVSATTSNMTQILQTIIFEAMCNCRNKILNNQPILLNWGVDQEQTENCGHGILLTTPWTYAQSFTPTKEKLTAIRLHIFKYGTPPESVQITVSIRDNLTNPDLATKTISASDVTIENSGTWVLFDFNDISITPENKYYIVCSGSAGNNTNAYCWFYDNYDIYPRGEAWIKPDENSIWTTLPHGGFNPDDYCFQTYFRKPLDVSVEKNNQMTIPESYNLLALLYWEQLFERFPNTIPILRKILGY